jgi:hypothetical protein
MIRLTQKMSLVALVVLAAATASAGEWAVWITPILDNPARWGPSARHKFPTLEDCDRHAALIFAEFHLMHPTAVLEARCLAETADWSQAKDQDLWQRDSY